MLRGKTTKRWRRRRGAAVAASAAASAAAAAAVVALLLLLLAATATAAAAIALLPDDVQADENDGETEFSREARQRQQRQRRAVAAVFDDADGALETHWNLLKRVDELRDCYRETAAVLGGGNGEEQLDGLEELSARKIEQVEDLARRINLRQVEEVASKLELIETKVVQRRQKQGEMNKLKKKKMEMEELAGDDDGTTTAAAAAAASITDDDLEQLFLGESLFEESDRIVREWILELLRDESKRMLEPLEGDDGGGKRAATTTAAAASSSRCATTYDRAANAVHQSLSKFAVDFAGLRDRLQDYPGFAHVVHEMTSDTYFDHGRLDDVVAYGYDDGYDDDRRRQQQQQQQQQQQALDEARWWIRYVPSDWESWAVPLLENWFDASGDGSGYRSGGTVPSWFAFSRAFRWGILRSDAVAPPEAVLDPETSPGSCWPMKGSTGTLTIRFEEPVRIEAISVDHASALLLSNEQRKSAPRSFVAYGYPPCTEAETCGGMGFDATKRDVLLNAAEYDMEKGGGVQTFRVVVDAGNREEEEELPAGSCAAESSSSSSASSSSSCDSPKASEDGVYAAVGIEVWSNWGNDAYTCLYRIRVHGRDDPSKTFGSARIPDETKY